MSDIVQDLKNKQKQIIEFQNSQSKLEGQREQLLKQLVEKFKVKTVDEAKKLLNESIIQVEEYENQIKELSAKMDTIIKDITPRPVSQ